MRDDEISGRGNSMCEGPRKERNGTHGPGGFLSCEVDIICANM